MIRAVAAVALVVGGLSAVAVVGRSLTSDRRNPLLLQPGDRQSSALRAENGERTEPRVLGAVVFSGGQSGRLGPCGCTSPQRGGVARQAALIDALRATGAPVRVVQLGPPTDSPTTPAEHLVSTTFARVFEAMDCEVRPSARSSDVRNGSFGVPNGPPGVDLPDRGRGVVVVETLEGPAGPTLRVRVEPLGPAWDDEGGKIHAAVEGELAAHRRRLRDERVLDTVARRGPRAADVEFVGSAACAPCHPAIHASWERTSHASALATLSRLDHDWDPSCVTCHTVGWTRTHDGSWIGEASGFRDPASTPGLGGVGCESCHGPGAAHAAAPSASEPWAGPRDRRRPGRDVCVRCHDPANSPAFPEGFLHDYLPRVDHRDSTSARRATTHTSR